MFLSFLLFFILGISIGSFLGAYTFRWPRGIAISRGRSFCPNCKKQIAWYDNIPVISYLLLRGRCRNCRQKISFRYPAIELTTASLFVLTFYFWNLCVQINQAPVCIWKDRLGIWALPYLILFVSVMTAIFTIDLESQLIPDNLVYLLLIITTLMLLISGEKEFFKLLLSGFGASSALLLLHLLTKGRGMGLGDVKLALSLGVFLGWRDTLIWLYLSFILGAIVGLLLITIGRAKFGKAIAFGPFLVLSFFIVMLWGDKINNYFRFLM